jgi:hypothetical protein
MMAVWPITNSPALRNGGANGGVLRSGELMSFRIAGTP